jgi:NAD(P)-dependent dehydrogenase (short-subunit alcohol dehydrogenase family)/acyl dehydratase/putative sterol carrier protein
MALNMAAVGRPLGPFQREYSWKDAVLYALGVGAGFEDLEYCYEKDLKVLPSFSIALIFDFLSRVATASNVNLAGILHGEQSLVFHNPLPPAATIVTSGRIVDYFDKGADKGALVIAESETHLPDGTPLFTGRVTIFARLDGGFGGPGAPPGGVDFPDREPDETVEDHPSPDQPLIYRLSGDIFPLHVDPDFSRRSGFQQPIMHGLCTHGFACRALISSLTSGRPERVRRFDCRFSKPLYPGTPIRTLIWRTGEGRAVWRTVNAESGEVVIDNGVFAYGETPADEIRFDGRVAVVTGAGGGLGRTYALELARRGARVLVNDLGAAPDGSGEAAAGPAEQVVAEIRAAGGEAVANHDTVATPEGGRKIVQAALEAFGSVDILINNAGILRDKSFAKLEPDAWQTVMDVHLNGAYHVTRAALGVMKENDYGRIVLTTSAAGLYGNFGQANYAAAKMALVGFMNALKPEGARRGILVNTVAPLATSRLTADLLPPEMKERARPELVAPLVIYLCSDRCRDGGGIYNAGLGTFNRAAVVTGPTVSAGVAGPPTAEGVAGVVERMAALENGREYPDLTALVSDMLTAEPSPAGGAAPTPDDGRFSAVADVFEAMPRAFIAEAAGSIQAVFQYHIQGAGGGEWFCRVADGGCTVKSGRHDEPTCSLHMAAEDFLEMINGTLPAMQAYGSGKLRIDGDVMKSQLIEKLFRL